MASVYKCGRKWRVQVRHAGKRGASRRFLTKAEAMAWGLEQDRKLADGATDTPDRPFRDLLTKYGEEVSPLKRGHRPELHRIAAISRDPLGDVPLPNLAAKHFAAWRDRRLKVVSPASVNRDWTLMSHACTVAINEWGWLATHPMKGVRKPKDNPPRDRRISPDEIEQILTASEYAPGIRLQSVIQRVGAAFLFAIETGMRTGEIASLTWANVDLKAQVATVTQSKNGRPRRVPLSDEAVEIVAQMKKSHDKENVFGISSSDVLSTMFRRIRSRTLIEDLHFHDTRHEAITRLARRLDVLDLARMVGHQDIRELMTYYNATAEDIVLRLKNKGIA